jgi:hypothetical protein
VLFDVVVVVIVAVGALVFIGRRRFDRLVDRDVAALFAMATTSIGREQLDRRLPQLPEPVQRYLRFAVSESAPAIRAARLRHGGTFRTSPVQSWMPIQGEQYFSTTTPGFVWSAAVKAMPLIWIAARDCLLAGRGNMLVKVESTYTIADARGAEIDQGATLRWLAEAAWFPYALAADAIEWQPIDAHSARAVLHQPGLPVSAVFEIDDQGKLVSLHAQRYRDLGRGQSVLSDWTGRYADYREFGGFRVPTLVDVSWDLDEGSFSYARFQVAIIEYNETARFT